MDITTINDSIYSMDITTIKDSIYIMNITTINDGIQNNLYSLQRGLQSCSL